MGTTTPTRRRPPKLSMNSNIQQLPSGLNARVTDVTPCQQHNPGLWFSKSPAELNLAKAHCRGCLNRLSCLAGAIERGEPTGVWGGEIFEDGRIIENKRPRGRPRKQTCGDPR
jgi:WhiB family transcriptional regulator, redox-sensing transcriptional regulator